MDDAAEKYGLTGSFKYTLGDLLGHGTFGRVYRAEAVPAAGSTTSVMVAVKTSPWTEARGVHVTAVREAVFLPRLRHPNIVRLIAVRRQPQTIDLVMELWNDDLQRLVSRMRRLQVDKTLCWELYLRTAQPIMTQLTAALAYCHRMGIMHRDVKPANVLLTPRGQVKLADFGAASTIDTRHMLHLSESTTLWYRSPEALLGETLQTPAIDAWALGIVCMEMMTLRPPLRGADEEEQLSLVIDFSGFPTPETWRRGVELLAKHGPLQPLLRPTRIVVERIFGDIVEITEQLFDPNPECRATCEEAEQLFANLPSPVHVPDKT